MLLNNSVLRIQFPFFLFLSVQFQFIWRKIAQKFVREYDFIIIVFRMGNEIAFRYQTTNSFQNWRERIGKIDIPERRGKKNNFLPLSNCRFFVRMRVVQRLKTVRECRIAVLSPLKLELVRSTNRYVWLILLDHGNRNL